MSLRNIAARTAVSCQYLVPRLLQNAKYQQQLLACLPVNITPCATAKIFKPAPKIENVQYPERRKLRVLEKVPQLKGNAKPYKNPKSVRDMRGPEDIHNYLIFKQYGIRALQGGAMHHGHIEMVRLITNRKMDEKRMFAEWRIDPVWKSVTKKGIGTRMGSGKGNISHYVTPIKAGRIIMEVGGEAPYSDVYPFLKRIAAKLPFKAEAVCQEQLDAEVLQKQWEAENNLNPFSFEYCIKNNMMGCHIWASPYDYEWYGKHR